jgi:hypothetical protein
MELPQDFDETKHCKIALFDKKKKLVAYALFDREDLAKVKNISWCFLSTGYVVGKSPTSKQTVSMHRYLLDATKGSTIDHINNLKNDNRRPNLRFVTKSQSAQNCNKITINKLSKFIGVYFSPRTSALRPWIAQSAKQHLGCFNSEESAAFAYDSYVLKTFGPQGKINNIEKPPDYAPSKIRKALPNVVINGETMEGFTIGKIRGKIAYRISLRYKNLKFSRNFQSLEIAKKKYFKWITKIRLAKLNFENEMKDKDIIRNTEGIAILPFKDRDLTVHVQVDDDIYKLYMLHHLYFHNSTYPEINIKGKKCLLHRLILNAKENEIVDHIDRNPCNALRSNLRIAPVSVNNNNRTKTPNMSSKYMGVSKIRNKFQANVTKDGVTYCGGDYENEELAAWARDRLAIKIYGSLASLNNVVVEGYDWTGCRAIIKNSTPKYRGVVKDKGGFLAVFHDKGKTYYCGYYKSEIVAAWAYDQISYKIKGLKAFQNGVSLEGYAFVNNRAITIPSNEPKEMLIENDTIDTRGNVINKRKTHSIENDCENYKKQRIEYDALYKWFNQISKFDMNDLFV